MAAVIHNNTPNENKGDGMKSIYVRLFGAFFGLAAVAAAARGQVADQIVVNIPYEFVAAGKTLPAGTYKINRLDDQDRSELVLNSFEHHTGVLLLSTVVEPSSNAQPGIRFEVIDGQHFLSKIETGDHAFTVPVPKQGGQQVASRQAKPPASGSSGSN